MPCKPYTSAMTYGAPALPSPFVARKKLAPGAMMKLPAEKAGRPVVFCVQVPLANLKVAPTLTAPAALTVDPAVRLRLPATASA